MHLKLFPGLLLAVLFVCTASCACAQVVPAATKKILPLAVGAGLSGYNPDYDHGHLLGGTLWIDYSPTRVPNFLNGIGIEAEAHDLNYGRSSSQPANLREDTALGGVFYSWRRLHTIRPYAKFLMGYGNTDYESETHKGHDSRTITALGGGAELQLLRGIWLRADYEYQAWPDFFKHPMTTEAAGKLNPQGFTIGVLYHFNAFHLY